MQADGTLELSLAPVEVAPPAPDEVIVRVEAAPINPSDLGLLLAGADLDTATVTGPPEHPTLRATIPPAGMRALAGRVGQSLTVGNEGAGTVVGAGASAEAQALLGKVVAVAVGAMYVQYRNVKASQCLELPAGTGAADGISAGLIFPIQA